jgi:hypothetical protein
MVKQDAMNVFLGEILADVSWVHHICDTSPPTAIHLLSICYPSAIYLLSICYPHRLLRAR